MITITFIGDEASAAGFRLLGVDCICPDREALMSSIESAQKQTTLLLLGAQAAQQLPEGVLDDLLASSLAPPVVVVPDLRGLSGMPDRLRQQLGLSE
ncbi:MAG: V-type ATP synthase subunit F [gamma proteobacterium symbiont of Bathyaustriella thionipta]|nr:V-type ATP synthase subunit F [gamma proteobacterium symbiont of Bathyaustriella thionipta]